MFSRLIRRVSSRVSSVTFADRRCIATTHSVFLYSASGCVLAPKRQTAKATKAKAAPPAPPKRKAKPKKETNSSPRKAKPKAETDSSPRKAKPKAETDSSPRKGRPKKEPKPAAEDPVESINLSRVAAEWRAACAESPAAAAAAKVSPRAGDRDGGERAQNVSGGAGVSFAATGATLARAAKLSDKHPALHGALHARRANVCAADFVVRDAAQLRDLLAFLRVYRTSAFGCAAVHAAVMDALVSAASARATEKREKKDKSEEEEIEWDASPSAPLLWLALELRRQKFEREPLSEKKSAGRALWVSAETTARLSAAITTATAALPISSSASAPAKDNAKDNAKSDFPFASVARGVAEFAMLLLAGAPADATARAQFAVDALLSPRDSFVSSPAAAQRRACDFVAALRLLALAEVALPPGTHERMRRGVSDAFQRLCATSGEQPFVFAKVLCAADVARSVCELPARDMRNAAEAAVFAGAALFCECAGEEDVDALFSRAKRNAEPQVQVEGIRKRKQVKEGRGSKEKDEEEEDGEEEEKEKESEEEFALQLQSDGDGAVELRSRRAKIAYALFAAGYSPESVLSSGLCGAYNSADILEVLRAAALFSRAFAFAPLPPREATALCSESAKLADRCIRSGDSAAAASEEILFSEERPPLRELLERGTDIQSTACSTASGTFGGSDMPAVLCVLFATATELLVRGEERRFADHFSRLLALLERAGSWDYLVDGLAVLIDGFAERCRVAGTHGKSRTHSGSGTSLDTRTAPAQESHRSLAEAAALCASRVADAAQRNAARDRRTAAPLSSITAKKATTTITTTKTKAATTKTKTIVAVGGHSGALLDAALRLTATAAACGVDETAARRIVHLHAAALKDAGPAATQLAQAVQRMHELVTCVRARQRELCRYGPRVAGALLHDVVAVHLASAGRAAPQLHDALAAVSLLFRLANDYAAVAEPAELRTFRTDVLDTAITRALRELQGREATKEENEKEKENERKGEKEIEKEKEEEADALDVAALGEVAVVMCAEHTIHHISAEFFDAFASATETAARRCARFAGGDTFRFTAADSASAARVLVAVAPVCRLRQEQRTLCFLRAASSLAPLLRAPRDRTAVLSACDAAGAPAASAALTELRRKHSAALAAANDADEIAAPDVALAALAVIGGAGECVNVANVLRRVFCAAGGADGALGAGDAGDIASAAAEAVARRATFSRMERETESGRKAQAENEIETEKEREIGREIEGESEGETESADDAFLRDLPAALAEAALRGRQQCAAAEVPRVLIGFARLGAGAHGAELQQRVMRAYILRTIQTCPQLGAREVVECLESYVAARVSHEYLYGVLLARVTDARVKLSLSLAVRLVDCGVNAAWDKGVQTACLTAAQPVFLGFVRRMLQSDPAALPAVSSHAVVVLRCLAEAFPNDPTGDLVLQCMATYHAALTTPTMIAVLRLISRKTSTEYAVLHCMTAHAVGALFPRASPSEFVELTLLLVQCGVRTRTLFEGVARRFAALRGACDGAALATLAEAFTAAHVDLEPEVIAMLVDRTTELAQETHRQQERAARNSEGPKEKEKTKAKANESSEANPAGETSASMALAEADGAFHLQLPHCIALLKLFALLSPEQTRRATSLLLTCAAHARRGGAAADSPADESVLLAACVRVAPVPESAKDIAPCCADALLRALETRQPAGWQTDLALLVQIAENLARLELTGHAAVPLLFEELYERRSALMRRRLLLQSATESIETAGEAAHKQLYALLVSGKLIA